MLRFPKSRGVWGGVAGDLVFLPQSLEVGHHILQRIAGCQYPHAQMELRETCT